MGGEGCTYNPGVLQGDHVVNVDIAGHGVSPAGVRADPRSSGGIAVGASCDTAAVTAKDILAKVFGKHKGSEEVSTLGQRGLTEHCRQSRQGRRSSGGRGRGHMSHHQQRYRPSDRPAETWQ